MPNVLAIAAHPDDIEFVMAGTMLQLKKRGWDLHYFNIANGCYGSLTTDAAETARIRLAEGRAAAEMLGATFYEPICDDMHIFYTAQMLHRVASVVRRADPQIVLTHAPIDYMIDHENACRLAVSAAFIKFSRHFPCEPPAEAVAGDVAVYHAQPHGNATPMREPVRPDFVVDCGDVLEQKRQALEQHKSQQNWLNETQGMSSYVQSMVDNSADVGRFVTPAFSFGEGWRQHLHLGFGAAGYDPLRDTLSDLIAEPA